MEPKSQPMEKENHLKQTFMTLGFPRCVSLFTFWGSKQVFLKAFRKESTNLTSEADTKREKHFQPATNVLSSLKTNGWNLNINGWISFWDGLVSGANC